MFFPELEYSEIPAAMEGFADESADVEAAVVARETLAELEALWNRGQTYGLTFVEALSYLEIAGAVGSAERKRFCDRVRKRLKRVLRRHVENGG